MTGAVAAEALTQRMLSLPDHPAAVQRHRWPEVGTTAILPLALLPLALTLTLALTQALQQALP